MILDTRKETCATTLQRACCPRTGCPCVVRIILDLHFLFSRVLQEPALFITFNHFRIFPYFSLSKKSLLHRFTNGKCEEFFRYIYDKMRDAEAEIRATITVQTTESTVAKKSDKDVSHAKTADGRRGTVFGGRRDTLIAGQRQNRKS